MRRLVATGKADDLAACVAFAAATESGVRAGARRARRGTQRPAGGHAGRVDEIASEIERRSGRAGEEACRDVGCQFPRLGGRPPRSGRRHRSEAIAGSAGRRHPHVGLPTHLPEAKPALLKLVAEPGDIGVEALRSLNGYDGKDVATAVLNAWRKLPPGHRVEVVNLLASRRPWAKDLMHAIATGARSRKRR